MNALATCVVGFVLTVTVVACEEGAKTKAEPPRSRVVAAKVKEQVPIAPKAEICDVTPLPGDKLELPQLADKDARPKPFSDRTWLNVWATWCKPCVEELPLLARWRSRLAQDGVSVSFEFLSADKDDETVMAFTKKNEGTPSSYRVADPDVLPAWLASIGLDEGAPLPVHVLTNARGQVVCARAGAVSESDYVHIQDILTE